MDLEEKRKVFEVKFNREIIPNFKEIFGNNNPLHLEIGSGRGEFIIEKSNRYPDINFIAVDVKEKRIKTIIRKLDPLINKNIRVIRMFIDSESIKFFSKEKFEKIYLMFPDPWPKRKHHRRRIINDDFITVLYNLLKRDGMLEIVTDHKEYALWINDHFKRRKDFKSFYQDGYTRNAPEDHIITFFEEKMRNLGYEPYYFKFIKKGE